MDGVDLKASYALNDPSLVKGNELMLTLNLNIRN